MTIRIFLVDDHALVRAGMRMILSGEIDIDVVGEAESGELALPQIRKLKPDVVLCDLHLPGRDGRWLMTRLTEQFPSTAVVMTTGIDGGEAAALLPNGAIGCLVKPFTFDQLETLLGRAVDWQLERATARLWKED